MVYINGKSWFKKLALKALDGAGLSSKGKKELNLWLKLDLIGAFLTRVWGVPLNFVSKKDNKVLIDDDVFENIAKIYEDQIAGLQMTFKILEKI